jgi:hypothetical protein
MELTDAQKAVVTQWVQEGRSLADVQRSLREDFEISMTYMDVRFLVDDLDIAVVEADDEAAEAAEPAEALSTEAESAAAESAETEVVEASEGSASAVRVDVDAIMRPGALVSGTVQFSDGVSLGWQLSATGQLGLIPGDDPEYRPSAEDVQSFQSQLEEVLRKKGY